MPKIILFVLPNGSLLESESIDDHEVYVKKTKGREKDLYSFMHETGALRVDFKNRIIDTVREPTLIQLRTITWHLPEKSYLICSITNKDGFVIIDEEFTHYTLKELHAWFKSNVGKPPTRIKAN